MRRAIRILLGLAAAGIFFFALWRTTEAERSVVCDLCVEYDGQSACRTGSGRDRPSAQRAAQSSACAVLSSGVTAGMRCDRIAPTSLQCREQGAATP